MDHKQSLDYRYQGYKKSDTSTRRKYDYAKEGILQLALPKILFRGNPTLVAFLQLIDVFLIYMFKTVESAQKFKYISKY